MADLRLVRQRQASITLVLALVMLLISAFLPSLCSASWKSDQQTIYLPNVQFKSCGGETLSENVGLLLYFNLNGTIQNSPGVTNTVSGTWSTNALNIGLNDFKTVIGVDVSSCWAKVPVELTIRGHATATESEGTVTFAGSGSIVTQKWTYTYENCPTMVSSPLTPRVETCSGKAFTIPSIPRFVSGGPADNMNTVFSGGNGPASCSVAGLPNYWVNTATLNLAVQDRVCSYPGRGPQLTMTHSYNADPDRSGMFGRSWRFAYDFRLTKNAGGAILKKGSGQELTYTGATGVATAILVPPPGHHDTLTWKGSYWLWQEKNSRWSYRFDKAVIGGTTSESEFRLTSITDSNANRVVIVYTTANGIQKITDSVGRRTTFIYDANDRVTRMNTPDGRFATYQYDGSSNLVQSVDLLGTVTDYVYDGGGYMTSLSAAGKETQFTYTRTSGINRIASVTDANGNTTHYAMTSSGVIVTDPLGNETTYTNTADGMTASIVEPLGNTTSTTYSVGNPTGFIDAKGNETLKTYDTRGNLTSITDPLGKTTTLTYDGRDNLLSTTNPLGETWTYVYDVKNNLVKTISPLNRKTLMVYDIQGQLTSITGPAGHTSSLTYNPFGNLTSVTDPLGNTIRYAYDAKGINKTAVIDARGNKTTFTHDANNRLTKVTYPDGTWVTNAYDCCSMTAMTDENGNTVAFTRDTLLNLTSTTDPSGHVSKAEYDKNSAITSITDALSRVTELAYNAAGRLIATKDPMGGLINSTYDANGSLVALEDPMTRRTTFNYDANNRRIATKDALAHEVSVQYDAVGRITTLTNARGAVITSTYDKEGQLKSRTGAGSYVYDAAGNLTKLDDPSGITAFAYDAADQLAAITYPDDLTVTFNYDGVGNVTGIAYPGGLSVSYGYDNRNRLKSASWGGATTTFAYDAVGNLTGISRPNGTATVQTHDKNSRVLTIGHSKGPTSIAALTYTRDALGDTTTEERTPPLAPPTADTMADSTYNDANQAVATIGAAENTFVYDGDGNLTAVSGGKNWAFTYDALNRLSRMTLNGVVTTFTYNGLGMRTRAVRNGQATNYHYDPLGRLLFETNVANVVTRLYVYAGGQLFAQRSTAGANRFYHFDKNGNTIAISDSTGTVVNTYGYDPYGAIINSTGSLTNPFTYVGAYGVMTEVSGIYFMTNRYYDANTGKFMQKDPIGFAGGINLYSYVQNSPVERIDPLGTEEMVIEWEAQRYYGFIDALMDAPSIIVSGIWNTPSRIIGKLAEEKPATPNTPEQIIEVASMAMGRGEWQTAINSFNEAEKMYAKQKTSLRRYFNLLNCENGKANAFYRQGNDKARSAAMIKIQKLNKIIEKIQYDAAVRGY